MEGAEALEAEIKELIIDALPLEDVAPEETESDAALFGEGPGLDAPEPAMALEEKVRGDDRGRPEEEREHLRLRCAAARTSCVRRTGRAERAVTTSEELSGFPRCVIARNGLRP